MITSVILATAIAKPAYSPIRYGSFFYNKHLYHMVTVDLSSGSCSPGTVFAPSLTSVWNLVGQAQPVVAITGTFFSPGSQLPVADVLVNGSLVAKGSRGTAVGVAFDGGVNIFDKPFLHEVDWSGYRYGLRGGVRVVDGGKVMPDPKSQRFRDSHIWGSASRTGLGLTNSGKLCLFGTNNNVTLREFGNAMKSHNVRNGVSLDGGGSTCFYYKGTFLIPPKRKLSNLFVVGMKSEGSAPVVAPELPLSNID